MKKSWDAVSYRNASRARQKEASIKKIQELDKLIQQAKRRKEYYTILELSKERDEAIAELKEEERR